MSAVAAAAAFPTFFFFLTTVGSGVVDALTGAAALSFTFSPVFFSVLFFTVTAVATALAAALAAAVVRRPSTTASICPLATSASTCLAVVAVVGMVILFFSTGPACTADADAVGTVFRFDETVAAAVDALAAADALATAVDALAVFLFFEAGVETDFCRVSVERLAARPLFWLTAGDADADGDSLSPVSLSSGSSSLESSAVEVAAVDEVAAAVDEVSAVDGTINDTVKSAFFDLKRL